MPLVTNHLVYTYFLSLIDSLSQIEAVKSIYFKVHSILHRFIISMGNSSKGKTFLVEFLVSVEKEEEDYKICWCLEKYL